MKIAMALSTLLFAGVAQAGTCVNADRTTAATFDEGKITVTRLNGVVPGGTVVKTVTVLRSLDLSEMKLVQDVITLKANLDDGGRTAIRFDARTGGITSIRLAYKDGNLEIYATDCR